MTRPQITWISADDPPDAFPGIGYALRSPNGLLAAGGDLAPERLLYAYAQGIFPWFEDGQPILWWSPDPRCVLHPPEFHVSRRFRRSLRNSSFRISFNEAFDHVISACGGERDERFGTWITSGMVEAYSRLHQLGWAHSVEVWLSDKLVGGAYGIAIGRAFFGESMFSRETNASKVALLALCRELESRRIEILDCQVPSPHLLSLGAALMPRSTFGDLIRRACAAPTKIDDWPRAPLYSPQLVDRN
ncbi:MAG: leucyl/phenylalanyl-tRNA--protein transferase [Woeseia sp.]